MFLGQELPFPAVSLLGRAVAVVVGGVGELHLLRFEVQDEEIRVSAGVAAVRLQPGDDGLLLGRAALFPELLRRSQTAFELFVRLE